LLISTNIGLLDITIVATLTGPISSSFNSLSLFSWLATAYLISNAACQPLSGRLTDIFGRKAGLIFSNLVFAAGNLICGLAQRQWTIILGRVIAGIGGGGLTAISTFVASDLIPLRKRGVWQGVGNICFGVGSGLGGVPDPDPFCSGVGDLSGFDRQDPPEKRKQGQAQAR
jgi:MFS family permease